MGKTPRSPADISKALFRYSKARRIKLLKSLDNKSIADALKYLDPDDITDILQLLPYGRRRKILAMLSEGIRKSVEYLLKFDPNTAAGLMNLNYIQVYEDATFNDVAKLLKKHERRTGKAPEILVVNKDGEFIGELPPHILALHKGKEKIRKYVKPLPYLFWNSTKKDVLKLFKKYRHSKVAVLDEDKAILGIIYSDDVLRILHEEATKSIYHFASVSEEEDVFDSFLTKVRHRYSWLIINLFTEFLAASVVSLFQNSIHALVLLAVYMPMVAGMGGNAATQTLAVIVRGLALNEIKKGDAFKIMTNEVLAGILNGAINGILVASVAIFINKNPLIGVAVFLAMIINLIVAAVFGTIVPLTMKRLGKDPASSATIFITTATDVFGFLSFLGIASLLM